MLVQEQEETGFRTFRPTIVTNPNHEGPQMVPVADQAMQLFGAAGFTEGWPLAQMCSMGRWLRMADGPDEVHRRSVANAELGRLEAGAEFSYPESAER